MYPKVEIGDAAKRIVMQRSMHAVTDRDTRCWAGLRESLVRFVCLCLSVRSEVRDSSFFGLCLCLCLVSLYPFQVCFQSKQKQIVLSWLRLYIGHVEREDLRWRGTKQGLFLTTGVVLLLIPFEVVRRRWKTEQTEYNLEIYERN